MEGALIQLIAIGAEDELLTSNPKVTFFKYAYMRTPLFYKNDLSLNNIKINWDDNYTLNIDKNIHLLGEVFVKVSLPYFQLSKTTTTTTTNTISNDILTKIIFYIFYPRGKVINNFASSSHVQPHRQSPHESGAGHSQCKYLEGVSDNLLSALI